MAMSVEQAKHELRHFLDSSKGISSSAWAFVDFSASNVIVTLDGEFAANELEALAMYMRGELT